MLQVRLLGELLVEADGRQLVLTGSWRARSLLAWLALNPGPHPRGELAARFWPDVLDTSARASLRNALWALRRELGADAGALLATRERVGLQGAWTDVSEFERLADGGSPQGAVDLWRGEPLTGLDDDWAYEARDELNRRLAGVLEGLAAAAEQARDFESAVAWTRRRAALDPLAEDAQRELIRRLAERGDRAAALEVHARLRERLRRELGISPSAATRELVEQIRDEAGPAPDRPVAPVAEPPRFALPPRLRLARDVRLIGRRAELDRLAALVAAARAGDGPRLALISGDAGIGKTRLAYELGLQAHRSGAIVLQGSCEEEALAPYEPFAEALGHWAREVPPSELAARLREAGPGLTALLPWLAEEPQSPATTGGAAMRYASFEAVASLLSSMHAQGGVVLVIDDLHWADASSAALLRHVLCARPEASVLVVATYRHDEAAARAPVAEMLARLHQDGLLERLPLTGLGRGEVDELVREVTGDVPSAGLTAAVHAETEGNPFFVAEIARRLGEGAAAHRLELPESVRELIERRLAGLGEPCLRLLAVAAVIGREFELAPLEHASDLEPQALEEALEEAVRAGLVVELPGLEDRLAFTHTLIRRTIADGLTRSRRRRIHACVAEALERVSGGEDAETWITYHLCEAGPAGDPDRAVAYALRAAERATQKLAYAEAVELYTRALVLLPREDPRRRKMALKRALAFTALGHLYAGDAGRPGAAGPGDGALSLRP